MARIELPNDQWADLIDIDLDTYTAAERNALAKRLRVDGGDSIDMALRVAMVVIDKWSFDSPPSVESLEALPFRTYDRLVDAATVIVNPLFESGDPRDPKAVTGSGAASG